jgi:hypothetical protein
MKNQYFGDINDYRKYGLLRILSNSGHFRIGVCWMLTANDRWRDGQLTNYLHAPKMWRRYDPQLFDCLHKLIVSNTARTIQLAQDEQILPGARYCDELLRDSKNERPAYFKRMYEQFTDRELIFFDPDNGIEVKSKPQGVKDSSKYIYWSELSDAFNTGRSILIYQHFPRRERGNFIEQLKSEIQLHSGADKVYWFRTPQVVYFLLSQKNHIGRIQMSIKDIIAYWSFKGQILVG